MIEFDSDQHVYTHRETGEVYISVTTLLELYKKEFDKDKHSLRVAEREGVSQELVLEMWEVENKKATDRGTKIHKIMENYINDGEKDPGYTWLYPSYDRVIQDHIDRYKSVLTENRMHNDMFKVAGTADLIYDHGNTFTIGDFKTNKKFNFTSRFDEFLLPPIDHLTHCQFNDYALQLSMYAYMYEMQTNKKCKKIIVFYLEDDKWTPIHCNYLKNEVKSLMSGYKLQQVKKIS